MSESDETKGRVHVTDSGKYAVAKAVLEHIDESKKQEIVELEKNNHWQSCCITMDKGAVRFFTQVAICGGVMIFCGVSLIIGVSQSIVPLYTGLMSFSLGLLFPQPTM